MHSISETPRKLKSILKATSKYATEEPPKDDEDHPHHGGLSTLLASRHDCYDDDDPTPESPRTPKITKRTPGVTSATDCFTEPPGTPVIPDEEDYPELFNYHGQVVTRSAIELLEMEDEIAARGGLYERDGIVMTASALSLLQAQEAMARADTAGQGEWGPDEWDGIRGQYVPKWASQTQLSTRHLITANVSDTLSQAKKLTEADRWPLVDDEGKPLRNEDGTRQEDWYEADMDRIEERNLVRFGMEGVVDYPY